jgi:hypothetical protein
VWLCLWDPERGEIHEAEARAPATARWELKEVGTAERRPERAFRSPFPNYRARYVRLGNGRCGVPCFWGLPFVGETPAPPHFSTTTSQRCHRSTRLSLPSASPAPLSRGSGITTTLSATHTSTQRAQKYSRDLAYENDGKDENKAHRRAADAHAHHHHAFLLGGRFPSHLRFVGVHRRRERWMRQRLWHDIASCSRSCSVGRVNLLAVLPTGPLSQMQTCAASNGQFP